MFKRNLDKDLLFVRKVDKLPSETINVFEAVSKINWRKIQKLYKKLGVIK